MQSPSSQNTGSAHAIDQRVEGAFDLAVIAIPVEGDAAPDPGDDLPDANLIHLCFQLFQQGRGAARFRAAPVEDEVQINLAPARALWPFSTAPAGSRSSRVSFSRSASPIRCRLTPRCLASSIVLQEYFVGVERTILHRPVEADIILKNNAPGADIHVTGFRVASFPGLQTDRLSRGLQDGWQGSA